MKQSKEDVSSQSSALQVLKARPIDAEAEKRAVRRLDMAVLPIMTMYYLLSFLVSPLSVRRDDLADFAAGSRQHRSVKTKNRD